MRLLILSIIIFLLAGCIVPVSSDTDKIELDSGLTYIPDKSGPYITSRNSAFAIRGVKDERVYGVWLIDPNIPPVLKIKENNTAEFLIDPNGEYISLEWQWATGNSVEFLYEGRPFAIVMFLEFDETGNNVYVARLFDGEIIEFVFFKQPPIQPNL